jgi:outer membrane protein insertion porin family/translocation and assembly module TamA
VWRVILGLATSTLVAADGLAAQGIACEQGLPEVAAVEFEGNASFRDGELANRIATTQSTFARRLFRLVGQRYCLDSLQLLSDTLRLRGHYYAEGFHKTTVRLAVREVGSRRVAVRFTITENAPTLVDSLTVNGLDDVPNGDAYRRALPLRAGARYTLDAAAATRDSLTRRLRNAGHALAEVLRNVDFDTTTNRAVVWYDVIAGPRMRIDSVAVNAEPAPGRSLALATAAVRRSLGITPGSFVSQRQLESVKRGLHLSGAFQHVDVSLDSTSLTDAVDTLVRVRVTLREGTMHDARASLGYGNIECLRAQGSWTNRAFLGGLNRLDLTARVARIGEKVPLQIGSGLCVDQTVRDSELADTLDYYVAATFSRPALFGRRNRPSITFFSEHRYNHPTYTRDVPIGVIGSLQRNLRGRFPGALSYQLEYGSTSAPQAYYCAVFNVCDAPTYETLTSERRRSAVLGVSLSRVPADVINPSRGWGAQIEVRHASRPVGSDPLFRFTRSSIEGTWVREAFDGGVLVLHARAGTVLGERRSLNRQAERLVPPQERLYAGGANSVRGYGQNELGPIVYVVQQFDTVRAPNGNVFFRADPVRQRARFDQPTGGDNVVVANAELRLRSPLYPDLLQYALFLDAGEVWNRSTEGGRAGFGGLRATPGVGARMLTPFGPVRIDFALEPRQLPAGPAYFRPRVLDEAGRNTPVYCLSPLNVLPVDLRATPAVQAAGNCPATFAPPLSRSLFQRLRVHFSIGQAF